MDTYSVEDEIEKAQKAGAYIAALAMALTIPDMCCGEMSHRTDYIQWYDDYVIDSQSSTGLKGDECYALRCALLHQQSAEISEQPAMRNKKPVQFKLLLPKENDYSFSVSISLRDSDQEKDIIEVTVDLLILQILKGYSKFKVDNNYVERHEGIIIVE